MTRRRTFVLVATLVLVAGTVVVWRPWDPVPDELRAAERELAAVPGVVDAVADYTVTGHEHLWTLEARSTVTVRLDDDLEPGAAGQAAGQAAAIVDDVEIPGTDLETSVRFEAGEPTTFDDFPVPPVSVAGLDTDPAPGAGEPTAAVPADEAADQVVGAFTFWRAGAARVSTGSAWSDDSAGMIDLARVAVREDRQLSVSTVDGTVSYDGYGNVPDVAAVRLSADTAARDGVATVVYTDSTAPRLSVSLTVPAASPRARDLVGWLEAPERAAALNGPVAYTLSEPGYATLLDGWVGSVAPPEPEERTEPLPDDVEPWPEDEDAPACTGEDLRVTLGPPDAATGARYLAARAENSSRRPCALDGVPEVVFRNADGEPQQDVRVVAASPGVVPGRVVVPPGETALATLQWRAMSTANDTDVTTALDVTPVPGADPVRVIPRYVDDVGSPAGPAELDVLDGAEVRVGPWAQAADGWSREVSR
ncbi:DUF4232 domain-containing protein [Isoptericola cucumis]|uniref:DUF4232 domain-containing protein n=1 Tax=Isoptericola cucumis TaxID=1776856 RepID=UPI00320B4ADD